MIIPDRGESIRCVALDWGAGGALIELESCTRTLDTFDLLVGTEDLMVSCSVAHRVDQRLGVQFSGSPMRATRFGVASVEPAKRSVTGPVISRNVFMSKYRGRIK
jgi:hypothetical protein